MSTEEKFDLDLQERKKMEYYDLFDHYHLLQTETFKKCRDNIRFPVNLFIKDSSLFCNNFLEYEQKKSNALRCGDKLMSRRYTVGDDMEPIPLKELQKRIKQCEFILYRE